MAAHPCAAKENEMNKLHLDQHISNQFNEDLEAIKSQTMAMGGLVELQVEESLAALIDADSDMAELVLSREEQVNNMELAVDEECARILVKRQPAASDLRMVLVITKTGRDLERIGDEAKKIAKMALACAKKGQSPRGCIEVRHIGETVKHMVHEALDALARFDVSSALQVVHNDRIVDQDYRTATRELMTYMMEDPRSMSRVMNIMWVLRSLERVGDHAQNIAEYVFYLVKGKDMRHLKLEELEASIEGS
jgi:phosphate transport system protein